MQIYLELTGGIDMGVRENKVEKYLDEGVKKLGGITRKWVSPGRDGIPDRIVKLPRGPRSQVCRVEVKTEDGVLSPAQKREQARLREAGFWVETVYGHRGVDEFLIKISTMHEGSGLVQ
jgi:hypothetical protein